MTSEVSYTIPADNVRPSKSEMRDNFRTIYDEITALQQRTSVAGAQSFYNFMDHEQVEYLIRAIARPNSYAEDLAYGRVAL